MINDYDYPRSAAWFVSELVGNLERQFSRDTTHIMLKCLYILDPSIPLLYEPRREETCLRGLPPGLMQTRLYSERKYLEARNFGFRKYRSCSFYITKTKALISCAVTAQLIYAFVFAHSKNSFVMMRLILFPFNNRAD